MGFYLLKHFDADILSDLHHKLELFKYKPRLVRKMTQTSETDDTSESV